MKKLTPILVVILFLSLSFATDHYGDGTFKLFQGENILSNNNYDVQLLNLSWNYGQNNSYVINNATYAFYYANGSFINKTTLSQNSSYTQHIKGTGLVADSYVNVTVINFGNGSNDNGINAPYAKTIVYSYDFSNQTPLQFEWINSIPNFYDALLTWLVNDESNGTITVYKTNSSIPVQVIPVTDHLLEHNLHIVNLNSNTKYTIIITMCNGKCIESLPYVIQTLPIAPDISNVTVQNVSGQTAIVNWQTSVPSMSTIYYRSNSTTNWAALVQNTNMILPQHLYNINYSLNLTSLLPSTQYEYKISSCVDICTNSSTYNFTTTITTASASSTNSQPVIITNQKGKIESFLIFIGIIFAIAALLYLLRTK